MNTDGTVPATSRRRHSEVWHSIGKGKRLNIVQVKPQLSNVSTVSHVQLSGTLHPHEGEATMRHDPCRFAR
jgi:hypothetical protein